MTRPDTRLVANSIGIRLTGVGNATGYYGEIGRALPGSTGVTPQTPPTKSDTDLRVKPYFLYTPALRSPGPDPTLGGCDTGGLFRFSITAVGGDVDDLLALVDRIENRLLRWVPGGIAPVVAGPVTHPLGYQASLPLTDRGVTPHRYFTAIPFEVAATT